MSFAPDSPVSSRLENRSGGFAWVGRTDVGAVRGRNEDSYLARPEIGLWAVADGMGGHQSGDVASALVIEALGRVGRLASGHAYLCAIQSRLGEANRQLIERASIMPPGALMGSTVVALLLYHGHYACLWAGDSRAYLHRTGRLRQITRDHSVVQALIDSGGLDPSQAKGHRDGALITRAVGADDPLALDAAYAPIETGDTFLICSDGLTDLVEDEEIGSALGDRSLDAAADGMMNLAFARGAKDNLTIVLVRALGEGGIDQR